MPILAQGKHICEKCGESFDWCLFELKRDRITSSSYHVEAYPEGITLVNKRQTATGEEYYEAICPHCGYDNHFSE